MTQTGSSCRKIALDGRECRYCRQGLTTHNVLGVDPVAVKMCLKCVARALVKMTITLHGDVGERPWSHYHRGHKVRMAAHEQRAEEYRLAKKAAKDGRRSPSS